MNMQRKILGNGNGNGFGNGNEMRLTLAKCQIEKCCAKGSAADTREPEEEPVENQIKC